MLCSLIHRTIKRTDSPFNSVKDAALFAIEILSCASLKRLFIDHEKGISSRRIREIVTSIHDMALLGIFVELSAGHDPCEKIVFGRIIVCGSKFKKTKECAGVGIKYLILGEDPSIMTRVIGFKRTVYKDGLALCNILNECFTEATERMRTLKTILMHLFPLDYVPVLHIDNMESLGVDGACISKDLMVNKRVLAHNPRCITNWCGSHKSALVSVDVMKECDRHDDAHTIREKLFDLVNASPKFEDLFKRCQVHTHEAEQFKDKEAVGLGDKPMHRWESTQRFNLKLSRLLLSTETFLAEIQERRWATKAKQKKIYPANYLKNNFAKDEFLITMAIETDVLEVLIHFVRNTEFVDQDAALYMDQVEDVKLELETLEKNRGKHTVNMVERLLKGDLKDWHDENEADSATITQWYNLSAILE